MLVEVLERVAAAAPAEALAQLLAAWPDGRHDAVAEAIVLLDRRRPHHALTGSLDERLAAWQQALAQGTPDAMGAAIHAFPLGLIADGERQLEALAARRDPRFGDRVARLLDDPPYRSPAARGFWQRAFEAVVASGDGRACASMRARRGALARELAHPMRDWVCRDLDAALASAPAAAPIPSAWEAYLEGLRRALGADVRADELLSAIHDAPHDDALRGVYADRLVELGDPRGELIGLQLARAAGERHTAAARKREKELLDGHARTWLGDLAPVILKTGVKLERGFLDACRVKAKSAPQLDKVIGHPAWSTVRAITAEDMSHTLLPRVDALLLHPVMRSLRVLDGQATCALFRALCLGPDERPLHTLVHGQLSMSPSMTWSLGRGWTVLPPEGPAFLPEEQRALTDCPGLPALRDLDISGAYHRVPPRFLRWFLDGELCRRLERLTIRTGEELIVEWIEALRDHPLPELRVHGDQIDSTFVLRRDERGRPSRLTVSFRRCNVANCYQGDEPISAFNDFLRFVERLGSELLTQLTLVWPAKEAPTTAQRDRLAALLERHPSIAVEHPA